MDVMSHPSIISFNNRKGERQGIVHCSNNHGEKTKKKKMQFWNLLLPLVVVSSFQSIDFIPRIKGDWRTIEARCETENWQSVMRTNSLPPNKNILEKSYMGSTSKVISLAKNMSKGQIISKDDLILVEVPENNNFESFTNFEKVVGRKITSNFRFTRKGNLVGSEIQWSHFSERSMFQLPVSGLFYVCHLSRPVITNVRSVMSFYDRFLNYMAITKWHPSNCNFLTKMEH